MSPFHRHVLVAMVPPRVPQHRNARFYCSLAREGKLQIQSQRGAGGIGETRVVIPLWYTPLKYVTECPYKRDELNPKRKLPSLIIPLHSTLIDECQTAKIITRTRQQQITSHRYECSRRKGISIGRKQSYFLSRCERAEFRPPLSRSSSDSSYESPSDSSYEPPSDSSYEPPSDSKSDSSSSGS